ncbi:hypothetical protein BDW66DRAFT_18449 [Aspergillus desertorum]
MTFQARRHISLRTIIPLLHLSPISPNLTPPLRPFLLNRGSRPVYLDIPSSRLLTTNILIFKHPDTPVSVVADRPQTPTENKFALIGTERIATRSRSVFLFQSLPLVRLATNRLGCRFAHRLDNFFFALFFPLTLVSLVLSWCGISNLTN